MTKECFKCHKVLDLSFFYEHSAMADGHLNKCKECTKKDVSDRYLENRDHYVEYEKKRSKTKKRKETARSYTLSFRSKNPEKYKAHYSVSNALRKGTLVKPKKCGMCGIEKPLHGHHDDYSRPLDVVWLCARCHNLVTKGKAICDEVCG